MVAEAQAQGSGVGTAAAAPPNSLGRASDSEAEPSPLVAFEAANMSRPAAAGARSRNSSTSDEPLRECTIMNAPPPGLRTTRPEVLFRDMPSVDPSYFLNAGGDFNFNDYEQRATPAASATRRKAPSNHGM